MELLISEIQKHPVLWNRTNGTKNPVIDMLLKGHGMMCQLYEHFNASDTQIIG